MRTSSGWDDYRLTCMHGIREGLDSHDCPSCMTIATETGADLSDGKTYLYQRDPRVAAESGNKNDK